MTLTLSAYTTSPPNSLSQGPIDFQLIFLILMIAAVSAYVYWNFYELSTDPALQKQAKLQLPKALQMKDKAKKAAPAAASGDHLASFLKGTPADPALLNKKEKSAKKN